MKSALVIGSGIGGMATAIRLQLKGYQVSVFEAGETYGGKLGTFEKGGFRWDTGPSLFTLPYQIDELFKIAGKDPRKYFTYRQVEDICHYFWEDNTSFIAKSAVEDFIDEASVKFNVSKRVLANYLEESANKLSTTSPIFLDKSLHKLKTYLSFHVLKSALKLPFWGLNTSLHDYNRSTFKNEKLVQLFDRFATYNGSSPYKTPSLMSMIPSVEMHNGTYFPEKGMRSIVDSLYILGNELGVKYHFNEEAISIDHEKRTIHGIKTTKGTYSADIVVSNMDVYFTYQRLLKDIPSPGKVLEQERSSSALIFYWGINRTFNQLGLHNIFFSEDYAAEFNDIFKNKGLSNDPTVYIHISSKEKTDDAPIGCENWFVMINTPTNVGQDWEKLKELAKKNIIKKLNRCLGVDLNELIIEENILDPVLIEKKTFSHQGSLYGNASNNKYAAFLRHPNFRRSVNNLYFTGGSYHPGGGIPLCLKSAKIVADNIPQA